MTPLNFDNNLTLIVSLTKNQDLKRENFTQVQQLIAGSEVFEKLNRIITSIQKDNQEISCLFEIFVSLFSEVSC